MGSGRNGRSHRGSVPSTGRDQLRRARGYRDVYQRDFVGPVALARIACGYPVSIVDRYSWVSIQDAVRDLPEPVRRVVLRLAAAIRKDLQEQQCR